MQKHIKLITIYLFLLPTLLFAAQDPWFTGPILAPAGRTIPRGHTNLEVYALSVLNDGQFDSNGTIIPNPLFKSRIANPILSHGFTDWMDVQLAIPYVFNSSLGKHSNYISDTSVAIGLQLLEQKDSAFKPNLRFVVQEIIPTGKYDRLNPNLAGTDATGLGSYETIIAFNFQHLAQVFPSHYLRTRLSLSKFYFHSVNVTGLSSYGGTINSRGTIAPGTEDDAVLAFEFTMTQHWVAVMEGYVSQGNSSRFNGILDIRALGSPNVNLGGGHYYEEALTPAIEYNFNANVGVIGGVWFPINGKNTQDYMAYVLAINAFW